MSARERRLGVLGTLVLDTLRDPRREEPVRSLGGITYALAALEAARPAGWSVLPIVKVGRDARDRAEGLLGALDAVSSREGVRWVAEPNNRVELLYREDGSRSERLEGGVPGWTWEELAPLARSCDALYVNLIAGWEVELASARRLRDAVGGPVYGDLHSLLLDRGEDGIRRPRAPEEGRAWAGCFDYLQLNEDELSILAEKEGEEPWTLAESLVGDAPRAIFVTLGPEGAAWVAAPGPAAAGGARPAAGRAEEGAHRRPRRGRLGPPSDGPGGAAGSAAEGDPTGCGDVWGITCFAALLEGTDLAGAVAAANRMAARNAARVGGTALLEEGAGRARPRDGAAGPRGRDGS